MNPGGKEPLLSRLWTVLGLLRISKTLFTAAIFSFICVFLLIWAQEWPPKLSTFVGSSAKAFALVGSVTAALRWLQVTLEDLRSDIRGLGAQRLTNHTIVCGLGECGMQAAQNVLKRGQKVAAIERLADSPQAIAGRREGIPVITGDAKKASVMRLAGVTNAAQVIVCTGDDAENIDVALRLEQVLVSAQNPRTVPLRVLVELRNDWLYSKLSDESTSLSSPIMDLCLFNTYETASRTLLRTLKVPAQTAGDPGAVVLVGCGSMGQQLLLDAIRLGPASTGKKTRIIVLEKEAEQRERSFLAWFPAATEFADIHFVPVDLSVDTPEAWAQAEGALAGEKLLAVAVCLSDDSDSLFVALGIATRLERSGRSDVPIHMRQQRHDRLGRFVVSLERGKGLENRLNLFGSLEELFDPERIVEADVDELARNLHDYYRTHAVSPVSSETQQPWNQLAETFKQSNRRLADHLPIKLAQVSLKAIKRPAPSVLELTTDEIETLAALEHRRWMIERRLAGWRYGPERNVMERTNPLLVDWASLKPEIQLGNCAQAQALPALLAAGGLELKREEGNPTA